MPKPAVIPYPESNIQLKYGFDQLADLLALTLGPIQGVVYTQSGTTEKPELLVDAATIARRLMQLPDRRQDVGAMLLRNLVWRMHIRGGDGAATAAVLARSILSDALRYRAAGANPMSLRSGIQQAGQAAITALQAMAQPVKDETDLMAVAETVTGEPDLSLVLGEIFDLLGENAHVIIEDYVAPYLEREYHEGGRWKGRLASPYLVTDAATQRAVVPNCQVVLFAGSVDEASELQPLLNLLGEKQPRTLALIAHDIKGDALAALVVNHRQAQLPVVAVELRRPAGKRFADMVDLSVLSGATILGPELGRPLRTITAADLGSARRAEADSETLILTSDGSHALETRRHIETLRAQQTSASDRDPQEEAELRMRLARLSGTMATLKVGANTAMERSALRQKAEQSLKVLPLVLSEGILPGGGVAYLNCIPAVRAINMAGDAGWGVDILARALEAPFRQIVHNAQITAPGVLLARAQRAGPAYGYDVRQDRITIMEEAGILDAAGILRLALETAISGAIMALTTDTVVLKRHPKTSYEP
jgi:chaperonin GroEL